MVDWLLTYTPIAFIIFLMLPGYMLYRKKERAELEEASTWFKAVLNDYARISEDEQRGVRLGLYHFFEQLWQQDAELEQPSDLLLRTFWHSSDEKLKQFVVEANQAFRISAFPTPQAVIRGILGSIAIAELKCRHHSSKRSSWRAIGVRNGLLKALDEVCPTLQIEMWEQRFPNKMRRHKLYPFRQ